MNFCNFANVDGFVKSSSNGFLCVVAFFQLW